MKNRNRIITTTLLIVCAGMMTILMPSCKKAADKSHLNVLMTDAPGHFNNVLVDVQGIEVTGNGGGTVVFNTAPGIYNLLDYANGINTLIATGDLDAGNISQIRLILGPNNSVMVDSVVYPLSTPALCSRD